MRSTPARHIRWLQAEVAEKELVPDLRPSGLSMADVLGPVMVSVFTAASVAGHTLRADGPYVLRFTNQIIEAARRSLYGKLGPRWHVLAAISSQVNKSDTAFHYSPNPSGCLCRYLYR